MSIDKNALPELPEPAGHDGIPAFNEFYTADQMRTYGELCRRAASPAEGRMGEDRLARDAYDVGWIECTNWAKRDDLVADMDSPAYMADRARNLAGLTKSPADSPATLGEVERALETGRYYTAKYMERQSPSDDPDAESPLAQIDHAIASVRTLAKKPEVT